MREIAVHRLGVVPYGPVHAWQEELLQARVRGEIPDTLLLLEHEPVITLGRSADRANILMPDGCDVVETGRGGDVTYHAPGQLVAYPIFDLKPDRCDVRKYVADLARVMVSTARDFGIRSEYLASDQKRVGVWVDLDAPDVDANSAITFERRVAKIGALGVRISRWVTMHGFALNVRTDLTGFQRIVPCGISTLGVTSIEAITKKAPSLEEVASAATKHFETVFGAHAHITDVPLPWAPQ